MPKLEPKSFDWNLEPIAKNFESDRKDWIEKTDEFVKKWKEKEDYLVDEKILKEALDDYETWAEKFGTSPDEHFYFWLLSSIKQDDPEVKAKFNKIEDLKQEVENKINFFELKLSGISEENQKKILNSEILREYRHFLEKIFRNSKHMLSESEEKIMNLKSTTSYTMWVKMVSEFISKEETEVLDEEERLAKKNFSELLGLIDSKNKKVRDKAAEALNAIFRKHLDSAEAEINAVLQERKTNDLLRNYSRADESRHVLDDMESETVDTLVKAIESRFDLSRRYYKLKAEVLGVNKLKYHERNVVIGEINKEYTYEESVKVVYEVFTNIEKEFGEIFKRLLNNRQIDVYPKKGKKNGAFCTYSLKRHPIYLMLNHTGKLKDLLTIAHESGHAINHELMKIQNSINYGGPHATAETASTFFENFVLEKILRKADKKLKFALTMQKLNEEVSTVMRQVSCDLFQRELHKEFREKGFLSKEEIGKIFQKHMSAYMGEYVEQSEGSENWWIYWGHIRSYFYNYQYAFGLLIAKTLQKKIESGHLPIERIKKFLSAGTSKSPEQIFKDIGVNIKDRSFWAEGLKKIEEDLEEAKNLAKELGIISHDFKF